MKFGRVVLIAALAVLAMGAAPVGRAVNWNAVVSQTPQGGYVVGNPNARAKLVEYVSYTCSHCADFEREADGPLRTTFIARGKASVEYRPLIRNKIDIAVALLATCGPVAKFRGNHSAFLRSQDTWFKGPSAGQEQRWSSGDFGAAMRAIATDLKLYDLMTPRGYTRAELDRCLSNRAAADKLAAQTRYAVEQLKVQGTPSFLINGTLHEAHDWAGLAPRLTELTR